ncbi:hormone receptor 4 [Schistocerca cancellata]|uniref:hormone receptor 4 n=1 Tax=Schistocerca cancellata TaxID=274614 RepID=UPI002118E85F|nr:hormone receptor 4 [Schistocerca cancellata]
MTLTTTPCELDTMSLFQDLKLKRRKVDSRCSSDGESVADTSTSSPDMVGPVSPCAKGTAEIARQSPSPALRDRTSPDSALPEASRSVAEPLKEEDPEEARIASQSEGGDNSVFDGGGRTATPARPAVIQHSPAFWMAAAGVGVCRINGVRPELIGGGLVRFPPHHPQPQPSPQYHQLTPQQPTIGPTEMKPPSRVMAGSSATPNVLRPPPTVIMGEAGGVRTMIWSQPAATVVEPLQHQPQQQQQQQHQPQPPHQQLVAAASTSGWSTSSSSTSSGNSEESSAAQMLLNLGQEQQPLAHAPPQQPPPPPQQQPAQHFPPQVRPFATPLNMERLWAGDLTQLPSALQQAHALNLTAAAGSGASWPAAPPRASDEESKFVLGMHHHQHQHQQAQAHPPLPPAQHHDDQEDEEQPMICMICEDKATGLHYGIITCEGCKGFFKRTVQNRRVYTCVADGNCEITKAQRNRCQYCRFKKCIEQGMVLQAVREDRMPGGRNSGAVYNLYKVKYKKHKKNPKNGQGKVQTDKQKALGLSEHGISPHLVNGTILKTALTNPSEVVHLRQRLDNAVSSSKDRTFPMEVTLGMIQTLIDCDEFQDIATLRNLDELLDHKSDLSEKLCQIGDSIVYKLVQWTKRLPFYLELPVEVHTRLLTHKWHELLVLTTSAYQAMHGVHKLANDSSEADFTQEVSNNLCILQTCLTSMMGRSITMDQLRQDVGLMVEKITHVTLMFRKIKLQMEEYVCLKVITMLNQGRGSTTELEAIQERYTMCLRSFVENKFPQQHSRFHDLILRLPEVQSAATLLLESKMFYVPFLLNSAIQR